MQVARVSVLRPTSRVAASLWFSCFGEKPGSHTGIRNAAIAVALVRSPLLILASGAQNGSTNSFLKRPVMDFQIRQLGADDAEAFSKLRRELTADNPIPMGLTLEEELTRPLQGFRDQLAYPEPNAAFGAFHSDELVASAAVAWPSKLPSSRHKTTLWGVFVSPRYRRKGLGRAVVQRAIVHAESAGVRRINLTVYVPNPAAVRLYESLQFEHCGVEPEAIRIEEAYFDGCQMSRLSIGDRHSCSIGSANAICLKQ